MNNLELITDDQIEKVWGNADFGSHQSKRQVIFRTLQESYRGCETGQTSMEIVRELGLVYANKLQLTDLGIKYFIQELEKRQDNRWAWATDTYGCLVDGNYPPNYNCKCCIERINKAKKTLKNLI